MPALRSAAALPTAARRAAGLDVVARDCAERLGAIIARPLRDEDDWSIGWTGCVGRRFTGNVLTLSLAA
jgi:hypothetical protein